MKTGYAFLLLGFLAACPVHAEAIRNGNELALNYSRADDAGKAAIKKQAEGGLLTFRFLKVVRIDTNTPAGSLPIYTTTEPSSDMTVILHPQNSSVSRDLAATITTQDCLAANGRLLSIESTNTFVIRPAALRSKDRAAPKGEKELLPEIDTRAVK